MIDEKRGAVPATSHELGDSFAASNSPSYGADLGVDFAAKNSVDPEHFDPVHYRIDRGAQRKQRRRRWYWLVALLLLVLTFVLIHRVTANSDNTKAAGGNGNNSAAAPSSRGPSGAGGGGRGGQGPAAISVGQSHTGSMPIYNDALGTVTPVYTVTVYPQVTGRVQRRVLQRGPARPQGPATA